MSRIGKQTILVPEKVTIALAGNHIKATGPLGSGELTLPINLEIKETERAVSVIRTKEDKSTRSLHGLYRVLVKNLVDGVDQGFSKSLEFKGIGYRVAVNDKVLVLNVGYSHPIEILIPEGLKVEIKKSTITVTGIDKYRVGEFAAKIRSIRKPEVYKGKGIRYTGEHIKIKPGKTAAKG